jgi:hypothetical protein
VRRSGQKKPGAIVYRLSCSLTPRALRLAPWFPWADGPVGDGKAEVTVRRVGREDGAEARGKAAQIPRLVVTGARLMFLQANKDFSKGFMAAEP